MEYFKNTIENPTYLDVINESIELISLKGFKADVLYLSNAMIRTLFNEITNHDYDGNGFKYMGVSFIDADFLEDNYDYILLDTSRLCLYVMFNEKFNVINKNPEGSVIGSNFKEQIKILKK